MKQHIQVNGRAVLVLVSVAAIAAACGSSAKKAAPTTVATLPPPPPSTSTSTTTTPPKPTAPLTGLPPANAKQLASPAVVVKIDNIDAARPQTGLNQADLVYEEEVEGGLTRLAAVFQSRYPDNVGPVRSGRLTDQYIADDLKHPVFVFSGTNPDFLTVLERQPLTAVTMNSAPSLFRRVGGNAPHNVYLSVRSAAKLATKKHAPAPLFSYSNSFGRTDGTRARTVTVQFPAARASWTYSSPEHKWLRAQNGTPDVLASHNQVSATNVVVMYVNYITSGEATGEGVGVVPIPEGVLTGKGTALFFSKGREVKGTWSRSSLTSGATYKDAKGHKLALTPGNTWIELAPKGAATTVTP